jgi:hypothetical protein
MSKVLVDWELLELALTCIEHNGWQKAHDSMVVSLRALLAQPAEADGVGVRLRRVIDELKAGFIVCQRCGDQEDTETLDCVTELESIAVALSAVTAERDQLRAEVENLTSCWSSATN